VNKLFRQLLQRDPGPLRMHLLEGVADDILSFERCRCAYIAGVVPTGYSSSPNGTKSRPALWTMRAASGRPKNVTSCPRAFILRPKAVIGCRCPVNGMLRKPIFIIYNSCKTVVTSGVSPH
jgi:hypothetical protein